MIGTIPLPSLLVKTESIAPGCDLPLPQTRSDTSRFSVAAMRGHCAHKSRLITPASGTGYIQTLPRRTSLLEPMEAWQSAGAGTHSISVPVSQTERVRGVRGSVPSFPSRYSRFKANKLDTLSASAPCVAAGTVAHTDISIVTGTVYGGKRG